MATILALPKRVPEPDARSDAEREAMSQPATARSLLSSLLYDRKIAWLWGVAIACLVAAAIASWLSARSSVFGAPGAVAAEPRVGLLERIANQSLLASLGHADAFERLRHDREVGLRLAQASAGQSAESSGTAAASTGVDQPIGWMRVWARVTQHIDVLLGERARLLDGIAAGRSVHESSAALFDACEQLQALLSRDGAGATEAIAAQRLASLAQRIAHHAAILVGSECAEPEASFLLQKDLTAFDEGLRRLDESVAAQRLPAPRAADARRQLGTVRDLYRGYHAANTTLLERLPGLIAAKSAAYSIHEAIRSADA